VTGLEEKTGVSPVLQSSNVLYHFTNTEDGKVIVPVKEVQPENALSQTILREGVVSNVIDDVVSDVQLENS